MRQTLLAAAVIATLIPASLPAQSHFGNALTLTGDTSWVEIGNHPEHDIQNGQDFTMSCWFRTPSDDRQRLLYRFDITSVIGFGIFVDSGRLSGSIWTPGLVQVTHPFIFDPGIYSDDQWHHVAFIRDGATLRLVVDGQTVDERSGVPTTALINSASFTIGADLVPENLFFFTGQIDEVRMWSRARSESEIRATMFDTLIR